MSQTPATIQADFDRIALLSEQDGWKPNDHYHDYLLKHLPAHCGEALEIGCGTGAFSRCLAERSNRVLALDLSPQMIRIAKERSAQYPNIDFQVVDALEWDFPADHFDCVASIATLHHLPLDTILLKMRGALKIGSVLLILDLHRVQGIADLLTSMLAVPTNLVLRLIHTKRLTMPREARYAWDEHGRNDRYLSLSEIRRVCADVLPGARVTKHLLWRYSIIWKKPRQ